MSPIWNSSLHVVTLLYKQNKPVLHLEISHFRFLIIDEFILWYFSKRWDVIGKNRTRWVAYINARISRRPCAWFQTVWVATMSWWIKRSMTFDIPLPHDAALTSCPHADNMCCFDFLQNKTMNGKVAWMFHDTLSSSLSSPHVSAGSSLISATREHSEPDEAATRDRTLSPSTLTSLLSLDNCELAALCDDTAAHNLDNMLPRV